MSGDSPWTWPERARLTTVETVTIAPHASLPAMSGDSPWTWPKEPRTYAAGEDAAAGRPPLGRPAGLLRCPHLQVLFDRPDAVEACVPAAAVPPGAAVDDVGGAVAGVEKVVAAAAEENIRARAA